MSDLDEQAQEVRGKGGDRYSGASVSMRDSRMSAVVSIGLAITPLAVVGIGAWVATSINELNNTVTRLVVQYESIQRRQDETDKRDDRQEAHMQTTDDRVTQTERDIASMGGPNYRGPRRGN